jgi:hypothetical protein
MHAALGRTRALSGKRSLALASLRKLETMAKERYVSPFEFAPVRFALGEHDSGFRALHKACEDRAFDVLALKVDPRFEALKSDPRFQDTLRDIGLP